jgi:hypothetical protein
VSDPIDRWLSSEPAAPVPSALAARIMAAVRLQARRTVPLPFPWGRFALGMAAGVLVCVLACLWASELAQLRWR